MANYTIYSNVIPKDYSVSYTEDGWGDKGLKYGTFKIWNENSTEYYTSSCTYLEMLEDSCSLEGATIYPDSSGNVANYVVDDVKSYQGIRSVTTCLRTRSSQLTVSVNSEAGYEFIGWAYFDGAYLNIANVLANGSYAPVILKPDFTFGGKVEVLDQSVGKIRILDHYESKTMSADKMVGYPIFPVLRYIKRTITFDSDGGGEVSSKVVEGGGSISLPSVSKTGYNFDGWYNGSTKVGNAGDSYTPSSDVALKAKWTAKTITVTFNPNGGTSTTTSKTVTYNSTYGTLPTPSKTGYTFNGWFTATTGGTKITATTTVSNANNHTLYAQWGSITITIKKKNENGGDSEVTNIGTLLLYDSTSNYKNLIAQSWGDTLSYSGSSAPTYRVKCELDTSASANDRLWYALGIKEGAEYKETYDFTVSGSKNLDYYFKKKLLYSITLESNSKGSISISNNPDYNGKYFENRTDIEIITTPNTGYELTGVEIYNNDNRAEILKIYSQSEIRGNSFVLPSLNKNFYIKCIFTGIKYSTKAKIDDNSKTAIQSVVVSQYGDSVSEAFYDDNVVYTATLKSGYSFAGWYNSTGRLVSDANPYTHTVKGSVELTVKAKVSVGLSINYDDNNKLKSCKIKVNNNEVTNPYIFDVILGESFSYDLVLGTTISGGTKYWIFNGWYDANDTLVNANRSGSITPDKAVSMVAKVMANLPTRTLTINFKNNDDNRDLNVSYDILSVNVTPKSKTVVGSVMTLEYEGDKTVTLTFAQNHSSGAFTLDFLTAQFSDGTESTNRVITYTLSKNTSATVIYGQTGERTTQIDFTDNCDRTFGVITIDGNSSESASGFPMSVVKEFNKDVEIKAEPKIGYRFVGWYNDKAGKEAAYSIEPTINLKVIINRTLYAKFLQDASRVYVWEGENENKNMIWRSKTYEATKPFNPSACRVDTTGYPVNSLSVEMFSSPYSSPTTQARLTNLNSQESRRLPIRRMERFLQVEIRNDKEVDAIYIGTSMGGLAI